MQLDDWIVLSPGARYQREKRWIPRTQADRDCLPEEIEWQGLVAEAAERFTEAYGNNAAILLVAHSCWFDDQHPVSISVRTRLPAGHYLQELPRIFLTFPVEQEPVADAIEAFKQTWSSVLSRLFDLPDDAIQGLIAESESLFRNVWFLHDSPCDEIQWAIARSVFGERDDLRQIGQELVQAIGMRFYVDEELDYDWQKARERIAGVIARYNSE